MSRTITNIETGPEAVVQLVDPTTSELAQTHGMGSNPDNHSGFVTFSEVDGMQCAGDEGRWGPSLNDSGPWKVSVVTKTIPDQMLVPEKLRKEGEDKNTKEEQYKVYLRDAKTGEFKTDPDAAADAPDKRLKGVKFVRECGDLSEEDFVRDAEGNKVVRTKIVNDMYKLRIGDTTNYTLDMTNWMTFRKQMLQK